MKLGITRSYRLDPIAGRDERRPLDHLAKMVPAALSLGGWGDAGTGSLGKSIGRIAFWSRG